ncbi:MAG: ATP-binding protein [Spirochaetota bacterium]
MSSVLVLNKDKEKIEQITEILENNGYIVIKSKEVNSAFNLIEEEKPDCIIFDYSHIKDNEDYFSKLVNDKIKSNKELKNIPFIISISKKDYDNYEMTSVLEWADEFINFPINALELKTKINNMIKLKKVYEKIENEQNFVSTILDNTESFITVTDYNFNILRYNNYASRFFYKTNNVLYKNFIDLAFTKEDYKKSIKETLNIFIDSDSKTFHPEMILTKKNNTEHPYKWTVTKEISPNGMKVLIFVGQSLFDTRRYETMIESLLADSKLKNMQLEEVNDELEKKNKELEELNALKTEYISIASHDLRSPISQIVGLAQLLIRSKKYSLNDKQKSIVEKIIGSAEFQLSLVSDILDITRVETGNMKIEKELTDINALVEQCVENLKDLAVNKGIDININPLEELRLIKLDSLKIKQVINNLVGNAVKFTNEGGRIDVSIFIEDSSLVVSVKDTGIGIDKEKQKDIFQKFSKNRQKGTMGEKGTGLGLSICKKMVELHGGTIGLESEYGKGSEFYFKIPTE